MLFIKVLKDATPLRDQRYSKGAVPERAQRCSELMVLKGVLKVH